MHNILIGHTIGTALTHKEMTNIVQQLATLHHPWNCPHGRPTMRPLIDMRRGV